MPIAAHMERYGTAERTEGIDETESLDYLSPSDYELDTRPERHSYAVAAGTEIC